MGLFGNKPKAGGFMDQIRCDEPEYLIWKWHPAGSQAGNNNRENAIRWGSSLRVKDGEVAVFVYNQPNGVKQDFIEGPFDEKIETKNFPILASIVGLAYDGGTPFQAEIYFINLARIIQTKFAVPFFDIYDPRFPDFGVPVAVRGTVSFKINDYREFIKLHRLSTFTLDDFQRQVKDAIVRYTKNIVANVPMANNIPVVHIETRVAEVNNAVEADVSARLKETFGVDVSGVDISAIELDKSGEGYRHLMSVTKDITETKVKAETEDYVERLRIQREEGQYAMHKQTQSANMGVFQVEKQTEVGIAGAEALGKMGANGAGGINLGEGGGTGFNPAAMMAGMALGGAVGQNIAGTMNNAMATNVQPPVIPNATAAVAYNVAVNGQSTGPYNVNALMAKAQAGEINADTLVWKPGMPEWVTMSTVTELATVISAIPPVIK